MTLTAEKLAELILKHSNPITGQLDAISLAKELDSLEACDPGGPGTGTGAGTGPGSEKACASMPDWQEPVGHRLGLAFKAESIRQSRAGETVSLGSFAQYVDLDIEDDED